jgi:thiol-disulfide isomerase/thioredoxin
MPSCILSGNRLTDFVLSDLNGQPFQLSQHKSRLVLLDFWGTWCAPCIQGMPYLVDLQRRYAPQGLEVIGIAYEEEMPFSQQVEQVNFIRRRQSLNYKILLGAGDSCPVLTKLDVRTFPTLVLLDEDGEIVWRGEGLSPQNKARLELEITRRIGSR